MSAPRTDPADPAAAAENTEIAAYRPRRAGRSFHVPVRGLDYHLTAWGEPSMITPAKPALVMGHGMMDVGASFQFVVDALAALEGESRYILAPDWRGYGLTRVPPVDNYWFADYLGDLDALLAHPATGLPAEQPIDLLGHSLGGNIVMVYAGVRPARIRRLVNLEGFGMPQTRPEMAPARLARWLDDLRTPQMLMPYDSVGGVARRLMRNNPRLLPERAHWLAAQWAEPRADGRWHIRGDPAHKRAGALLYRAEEVLACWKRITAPVLWAEGDLTDTSKWWGNLYPREEFEARLAVVPQLERHVLSPSGHMVHHDQPEALAGLLQAFLA
ncbi:MAG TPA: alpha/beta fold hydrolase [Ideonella sp.]|nr:alpha/beta fold hydrolase [Ideonella sp.]